MTKHLQFATLAILSLAACSSCGLKSTEEVSLSSLLDEMTDIELVTRTPSPYYTQKQVSSHDRRSVSPDKDGWFANKDWTGIERTDTINGRTENVIFNQKGPGAITRIWMTTKGKDGVMRFYFDGSDEPEIIVPAYDMKRFPLDIPYPLSMTHTHYQTEMSGVGGNTFFLPIPYSKSLKVTFEEKSPESPRYLQINYRTYEEGTAVRSFTLKEANKLKSKIDEVAETLTKEVKPQGKSVDKEMQLASGESLALTLPSGTKAVRQLNFAISGFGAENYASDMENLILEMSFDGKKTVSVPLSHFSGAGVGAKEVKSLYMESDGAGHITCNFPMPYKQNAEVSVTNKSSEALNISISAIYGDYDWDDHSLYFHCAHKEEFGVRLNNNYDSNDNLDWNFMTIKGKGNYCGDLLSLFNHAPDWYGEGDEKIWVDDDTFPSHFGTGTEDYYNCSWAPVVVFQTPFGGATRSDEPSSHGYNTFFRTRILDVIPFKSSFRYDLEMLSWNPGTIDLYSTSFWYGESDSHATL